MGKNSKQIACNNADDVSCVTSEAWMCLCVLLTFPKTHKRDDDKKKLKNIECVDEENRMKEAIVDSASFVPRRLV